MEKTATKYAVRVRIYIIVLQYLGNIIIPDHEAGVFLYPQTSTNYTTTDKLIHHFLGGFLRWDAQYFMHIAKYGYTYENTLAFFPLYPLTVRLFGLVIFSIFPLISLDTIILLIFIALNFALFVLSAKALFQLTALIFDEEVAYKSTLLFCVNPASIFFSAPYTECMFCYLTFQSVLNCLALYKKYYNTNRSVDYHSILYILPICLSTVVRSNGILNIGFLAYVYISVCIKQWPRNGFVRQTTFIITKLFCLCFLTIICLIPFCVYQIYCYYQFCTNFHINFHWNIVAYAEKNDFVLPGNFLTYNQSWCSDKIPLAYSYVQKHYWHVGFLKYYKIKQLPNFLLAAPIFIVLIKGSLQHILHNNIYHFIDIFSIDKLFIKKKPVNMIGNPILTVFVIHILFLSLFCGLFVHIQVSTRMLCSASPIVYWFCANYFKNRNISNFGDMFKTKMSFEENAIIIYFSSYFIIGTIMFCNNLPWT